jgi:hypothetical protein
MGQSPKGWLCPFLWLCLTEPFCPTERELAQRFGYDAGVRRILFYICVMLLTYSVGVVAAGFLAGSRPKVETYTTVEVEVIDPMKEPPLGPYEGCLQFATPPIKKERRKPSSHSAARR